MSSLIPFGRNRNRGELTPFDFMRSMFQEPFWSDFGLASFPGTGGIRADVRDNGNEYVVEAEIPGVNRDRIHLDVQDGTLIISTDDQVEKKEEREGYIYRERRYGRQSRCFPLDGVRENDITAQYKDGVLTVHLPKSDVQRQSSRRIDIG